jgi:hypothetical protein
VVGSPLTKPPPAKSPLTRKTSSNGWPCGSSPAWEPARRISFWSGCAPPQAIFRASRSELEAAGLSGSVAQTIASGCTFDDAVDQQQKMLESDARLVAFSDPAYPARR